MPDEVCEPRRGVTTAPPAPFRRRRHFQTRAMSTATFAHRAALGASACSSTSSSSFRVRTRARSPRSRALAPPRATSPSDEADAAPRFNADALFASDKRPIILFDGVCNLCNGGVNLALDLDPPGRLRFAALQSPAGRALLVRAGRDPDDISSIVLVEETNAYVKSDAVLRIATYLENPLLPAAGTLGALFPGIIRDAVYDLVADNRYDILGVKDECRLGDDRFDDRFVSEP